MKCKEINNDGSFIAWGIGFHYKYDAKHRILDVTSARNSRPLTHIVLDDDLSESPFRFVLLLEKATQIQALMLSNNATIDLSENFEDERLIAIFISCMNLARFSYNLSRHDFQTFEKNFCEDMPLKSLRIQRIECRDPLQSFYSATLETETSKEMVKRAHSLGRLAIKISEGIIHDLISAEYGYRFKNTADALLSVSSKLSIISLIINDAFLPAQKLSPKTRHHSETQPQK